MVRNTPMYYVDFHSLTRNSQKMGNTATGGIRGTTWAIAV